MDTLQELHERERAELARRHEAERTAAGLDVTPIATWNAFAPDQLADVITGVTRCEGALAAEIVRRLSRGGTEEFSTERRDTSGILIGGARWRIEREDVCAWKLHLLESEPEGTA
jgi:hypothetical protein